jgi:hypothetical protein
MRVTGVIATCCTATLLGSVAVPAQVVPSQQPGEIGKTSIGTIGQRQTRASVEAATRIRPTERIDSRIESRTQSRIRSRIDRNYVGSSGTTTAINQAAEQIRTNRVVQPR